MKIEELIRDYKLAKETIAGLEKHKLNENELKDLWKQTHGYILNLEKQLQKGIKEYNKTINY